MENLNLPYLKINSAKSYAFCMIPQELLDNPAFDGVDYGSKILYGRMLNRASLSAKNPDFIDEKGNVYIIYTVEQVMADMRCSNKTAIKMLKQLDEIGLIEKKRQGLTKPNIIYVKDFSGVDLQKCKKYTSGSEKNTQQRVKKVHTNNINHSKTNNSKTESINQGSAKPESFDKPPTAEKEETTRYDTIDNIENENFININNTTTTDNTEPLIDILKSDNIPKTIADNISLDELVDEHSDKKDRITELYNIVCDVLNNNKSLTIRINKQPVPIDTVKCHFAQLNKSHIVYVLHCLEKNAHNIKTNSKAYITTSLFHSIRTIDYYQSYSNSAFKSDNDTQENQSSFDINKFFERAVKKSYINLDDDISASSFQSV